MNFTAEDLLWYFRYDRENGKLYWKNHWAANARGRWVGKEAGTLDPNGYLRITLHYKRFLIHRLIWIIENNSEPEKFIDHIDGNKLNNRISNLRVVSSRTNQQNLFRHRKGKLVGSSFHKLVGRWQARITVDKKLKHLGWFNTELEAHQRYLKELEERGLK